jgi:teichuronic acid exporter
LSLKERTINGLKWSFIDNTSKLGLTFIIGIILARILSPREFGLLGMISIFIAIAASFVDSGFSQALIRKQNCSQEDYSTIFYFNLAVGLIFYSLLFISAESISLFFNEPLLKPMVRILGLGIIINSFTIVQTARLTKQINFKLQTKISIIATIISGIAGIVMAFLGYGVWSLVFKTIFGYLLTSILLWCWNKWIPSFTFSFTSLKDLFSFGSRLLISGLIDTTYRNLYYFVIGKYFAAEELGYYTRANQFQTLPSSNLQSIISRVSYPVLSTIQDDILKLKKSYITLIRSTMFITFILMIGMASVARPMVLTLIGEKWEPCIIYLQMLCFVGMFYPLQALNLNMLQVLGRSDLFLKIEIIKKTLAIPTIIVGIIWGVKAMIIGMMFNTIIGAYINSYWSGRFIGYPLISQIRDILPSLLLAIVMSLFIVVEGFFINLSPLLLLVVQLMTGILFIIGVCEKIKFSDYLYIKKLLSEEYFKHFK